jgi:hypothetical protein
MFTARKNWRKKLDVKFNAEKLREGIRLRRAKSVRRFFEIGLPIGNDIRRIKLDMNRREAETFAANLTQIAALIINATMDGLFWEPPITTKLLAEEISKETEETNA